MKEFPNLSYIYEIAGTDSEFQKEFIKLLKEEFLWEVGSYLYHIERNECRAASYIVAKSKSKLRMLGLQNDSILADIHEENLRTDDIGKHHDFKNILGKVNAFLEHL